MIWEKLLLMADKDSEKEADVHILSATVFDKEMAELYQIF